MTITDPPVTDSRAEDGGTAFDQLIDRVRAEFDTQFTWDYGRGRDGLNRLYEKAKRSQWNVSDDLDWSTDVDPERMIRLQAEVTGVPAGFPARSLLDVDGSPVASWNDDEWVDFAVHSQCASLSQFLHGEQGALLCTARLVEAVPWIEAKYYGSTQVVDEARHVEAFARYLDEKMPTTYPINENLKSLLDTVLTDDRWDLVYLGMQVVIEGLALAAFGMMLGTTQEPLLKQMLRYVMADEARHVAFGILSLREIYDDLPADEFRLRQEFAYEACDRMRRRTLNAELWPHFGIDNADIEAALPGREAQQRFQHILFSKIVPNCKKLGLLDHRDGWLRERFQEMNIIQFEDWENTAEALNLEGRVEDSEAPTSFDPDALEGVEVIDDPIHASRTD